MERRAFLGGFLSTFSVGSMEPVIVNLENAIGKADIDNFFVASSFDIWLHPTEVEQFKEDLFETKSWWYNTLRLVSKNEKVRVCSIFLISSPNNYRINVTHPISYFSFLRFMNIYSRRLKNPLEIAAVFPGQDLSEIEYWILFAGNSKSKQTSRFEVAVCEGRADHLGVANRFCETMRFKSLDITISIKTEEEFWTNWNKYPLAVYDINVRSLDRKLLADLFSSKNSSWETHPSMVRKLLSLIS